MNSIASRIGRSLAAAIAAGAVVLLAGCGGEDDLDKAARQAVESNPSCARPVNLTPALAADLTTMGALACKSAAPKDCQPVGDLDGSLFIDEQRDMFGRPTHDGARRIMLCGRPRIDKFTGRQIEKLPGGRMRAEVRYVVTPMLRDDFRNHPKAKELMARLGTPGTFSSSIVMQGDGTRWWR